MNDTSNDFDETIQLSNENYEDREKDILDSMSNKESVSSISLISCNLTPSKLTTLITNIKDPSYLFEIDVSNNVNLGPSVVPSIFQSNISPLTLILDNIQLRDDGFISLSKCIENVRILSVASNEITSRGVIVFFSSVDIQFTSLNLSENRIDDSAIFSIKTNIKKLNISSNNFTTSGLIALCERFSKSDTKTLYMNELKFSKVSKQSFSKLLQSKHLKNLYLRNCSISHFPDIPSDSRLKILDLTGNSNIVEFETTPTVTVIGNFLMKKKIQLNFKEFDKMKEIIDDLRKESEIIVDQGSDTIQLIEKIQSKTNELNSLLLRLKRKVKPSVSSLSKYASKINSSDKEIIQLPRIEKVVEGFPLTSSLSLSTKFNVLSQFLMILDEMNENSKYFKQNFKIDSFVITKSDKLHIKNNDVVVKSKSEISPIENFSNQLFGFIPDISQFNYNFSHSLLTSSINKVRPPPSYTITRTEESILDLFSRLNNSELMTQFQLKVEGESAIDHGGVLRDIFSQFWETVSISKFEMSDNSVSLLPIVGGENFCEIGKIMAKSLLDSIPISIPIHSIIFRFLTNQLPSNKIEWVQSLSEFDPQIAGNIGFEAENDEEIIDRCKEILINRREKELNDLKKGFFFNHHVEIIIANMFDWWNLMSDVIGDEELNSKKILNEIKFMNFSEKSINIWSKVILKFNKDQIKQFLRLITGLNGIPSGGYKKRGKQLIISKSDRFFAHTCSFELESPDFHTEKELIESLSIVFISMESDYSMNEWYNI